MFHVTSEQLDVGVVIGLGKIPPLFIAGLVGQPSDHKKTGKRASPRRYLSVRLLGHAQFAKWTGFSLDEIEDGTSQ